MFFSATDFCFARYSSQITRIKDQSLKGLTLIAQMNFGRLFYEVKTLRFSAVLFFNSLREWFFQPRIKQITRIKDQSLKGLTRIAQMNFGRLFYEVKTPRFSAPLPKKSGQERFCFLIRCANGFFSHG